MSMTVKIVTIAILFLLVTAHAEDIPIANQSYAEEYGYLAKLLQQVQSRESAILYKPQIENELVKLKSSQMSGEHEFESLSISEQKAFIKKFQNNQFHCGAVTRVMEERRRILLDPDLSQVLSSLMNEIP